MSIEAPISAFKKNNLRIYIIVCLVIGIWCAYDGYFNDEWIAEHTDADGNAKPYLVFNRKAPAVFIAAAIGFGGYFYVIRNKKIIADERELIIDERERITYDSIEKIDKSDFKKKGSFTITYKALDNHQVNRKLSERTYDNLEAVLDKLVEEIT